MNKILTRYIPAINPGHGKVISGQYQTPGKRSPDWEQGVLYEGMFNNWVVNRIIEKLDRASIPYYHVAPEYYDVSLPERKSRMNEIAAKAVNVYLFEVHANGGGGKGIEGFTSVGQTAADPIADAFLANIENHLSTRTEMRFDWSDGDRDKERNFYMLRNVTCPAFLLECGFMDSAKDYYNLWDPEYLEILTDAIVETMENIYTIGI